MSIELDDASFEVIGSTVTFTRDNLPRRLRPIYRRKGEDHLWFTAVTREREESTELARLDPTEVRGRTEDGHALLFDVPIPARVGHRLLQLWYEDPPIYVPAPELPLRFREAASEALRRAASAFSHGASDDVQRWLWYARRASIDDPLPILLLLHVLERAGDAAEGLLELQSDLAQFDRSSIEASYQRLQHAAALAPFQRLSAKPAYLPAAPRGLARAGRYARGPSARAH